MAKGKGRANHKSQKAKPNRNKEIEALIEETNAFTLDPSISKFSQLPLSDNTKDGLQQSHFIKTTDIQLKTILPALKGKDILGAARTGSGKTLAFLVPVLEVLHRKKWTQLDGLGALIISPTRELAIQIFEVLRKIGRPHGFSAGLVMGGKDVKTEAERLGKLNILIGTPGRILQHMDQTAEFDASNLQVLILDEADRILDMGFKKELDAIVENLPMERQTWLFSATQTKTVSDLARLSLKNPEYISVDEESATSTPKSLEQFYITTPLPDKLSTLYSFIKTHLKAKVLVFFSSSKQVRYVYETFRTMQPGTTLIQLHGKQKQAARIDAVSKFSTSRHCCLFATDVVARGIDFPTVDWVVQVDAPEDAATYIHRVGRTARFGKNGTALLFLTPKEEPGMVNNLESRKIPIKKLTIRENKRKQIQDKLQALCFKNPELKFLAHKAFQSYTKSIYLQKDKSVFNVDDLPLEEFAASLGLMGAPKIKFKDTKRSKELKNAPRQLLALMKANEDGEIPGLESEKVRTKYDRMFERKNQTVLSDHYLKITGNDKADEEDDEDFMTVKRSNHDIALSSGDEDDDTGLPSSKRAQKRALSKKQSSKNRGNPTKLVFDDEGKPHAIYELENEEDFKKAGDAEVQKEKFLDKEKEVMLEKDVEDKAIAKDKRLEKKRKRQEMERLAREEDVEDSEEKFQVYIGGEGAENNSDYDNADEADEADEADGSYSSSEEDEDRTSKKPRNNVYEVEEPETLEDLEALSSKLLRK
ncbi:similar to Saccharomyces cerevisiae YJL033W HCA4 Putative nucleolar DEAD box RNA helicase [Geotrichum candidum]|uniref:ATP-dependent RNA helicase n=1 Tax=Geotrichum candidum TaxID=1173061 RepID=A0A0J9XDM2_GEOCN|nr:similar to Saccharomyces cerevisiae YJL033W HCA4 Putative nucleolar DEAD box RNA helicase [Geotrichum candidum]